MVAYGSNVFGALTKVEMDKIGKRKERGGPDDRKWPSTKNEPMNDRSAIISIRYIDPHVTDNVVVDNLHTGQLLTEKTDQQKRARQTQPDCSSGHRRTSLPLLTVSSLCLPSLQPRHIGNTDSVTLEAEFAVQ
ncbi:hypothetical protein BLNAU_10339 [Blattamonas nauphoetae]|uniref:Uncharacterized protein n=1 Tax=Blattamonas nauphoetae TaxID=2049346 RepID=A0ABQ9XT85_9EUKA|nr:hypothetical protein BLNAU_10339 [Blattamonas nauphoetae]